MLSDSYDKSCTDWVQLFCVKKGKRVYNGSVSPATQSKGGNTSEEMHQKRQYPGIQFRTVGFLYPAGRLPDCHHCGGAGSDIHHQLTLLLLRGDGHDENRSTGQSEILGILSEKDVRHQKNSSGTIGSLKNMFENGETVWYNESKISVKLKGEKYA